MIELLMDLARHIYSYLGVTDKLTLIWAFMVVCICIVTVICMIRKLLNSRHRTQALHILHNAISQKDVITTIKIVHQYPELVNVPLFHEGYTPFMRACLNGSTQIVKYLIKFGADFSIKTKRNETPFYLAVFNRLQHRESNDASCIHALYHAGADINAPNNEGYTPLQLAAAFGHTSLIRWLLQKGASRGSLMDAYFIARAQGCEFGKWEFQQLLYHESYKITPSLTYRSYNLQDSCK